MTQPRKKRGSYRPRLRREDNPRPVELQDRDIHIFHALFENRLMTTALLAKWFGITEATMSVRLAKLYHAGYIDHFEYEMRSPFVHTLLKQGVDAMRKAGQTLPGERWKESDGRNPFITQHTVLVSEFRTALEVATRATPLITVTDSKNPPRIAHRYEVADYEREALEIKHSWTRAGFKGRRKTNVNPDAFFVLRDNINRINHHFFLEADRGTMMLSRLFQKYVDYQALRPTYGPNGKVATPVPTNGKGETALQLIGARRFKVLTVFETEERLKKALAYFAKSEHKGRGQSKATPNPIPKRDRDRFLSTHRAEYAEQMSNLFSSICTTASNPKNRIPFVFEALKKRR